MTSSGKRPPAPPGRPARGAPKPIPGSPAAKGSRGAHALLLSSVQDRARAPAEPEGRRSAASRFLLQAGLEQRWGREGNPEKLAPHTSLPFPGGCKPRGGSFKLGAEQGRIFAKLGLEASPTGQRASAQRRPFRKAGGAPEPCWANRNFPAPARAQPRRSPLILGGEPFSSSASLPNS